MRLFHGEYRMEVRGIILTGSCDDPNCPKADHLASFTPEDMATLNTLIQREKLSEH